MYRNTKTRLIIATVATLFAQIISCQETSCEDGPTFNIDTGSNSTFLISDLPPCTGATIWMSDSSSYPYILHQDPMCMNNTSTGQSFTVQIGSNDPPGLARIELQCTDTIYCLSLNITIPAYEGAIATTSQSFLSTCPRKSTDSSSAWNTTTVSSSSGQEQTQSTGDNGTSTQISAAKTRTQITRTSLETGDTKTDVQTADSSQQTISTRADTTSASTLDGMDSSSYSHGPESPPTTTFTGTMTSKHISTSSIDTRTSLTTSLSSTSVSSSSLATCTCP